MTSLVLAALLAGVDAGPRFLDSQLGFDLAGHGTEALDERWVQGLASQPLLLRVERLDDGSSVAFYRLAHAGTADAGPVFDEVARFKVPGAPQLDEVKVVSLGSLGPAIWVQVREVVPDEDRVTLQVIGPGPKLLFHQSYLHIEHGGRDLSLADRPEGFSLGLEGDKPVLHESAEPKWLPITGSEAGLEVELGRVETDYVLRDGVFAQATSAFREFVPRLAATAPGSPALVDQKLDTGATLQPGRPIRIELTSPAAVRFVRIVTSCAGEKGGAAKQLSLDLGSGSPSIAIEVGKPIKDSRVLGSGAFDLGHRAGEQELVFFEPPVTLSSLALTLEKGLGPGGSGCLAEVSLHGQPAAPK